MFLFFIFTGHNVTVWNRTAEKCKEFVKAGAKEAMTPGDVIAECDITFSCVSDPQAAKEMVLLAEEGYVERGMPFDQAWQEMLNHSTTRVSE